jgi:hypothetical protein
MGDAVVGPTLSKRDIAHELFHNLSGLQARLELATLDPELCKGGALVREVLRSLFEESGELICHRALMN